LPSGVYFGHFATVDWIVNGNQSLRLILAQAKPIAIGK
jgi:hypothetical protein